MTYAFTLKDPLSGANRVAPVTGRQLQVLAFYRDYLALYHCPPVVREVCQYFSIASTQGAMRHLQALVRKGMLVPAPARGYAITEAGRIATDHLPSGHRPTLSSRQNRCLMRRLAQQAE